MCLGLSLRQVGPLPLQNQNAMGTVQRLGMDVIRIPLAIRIQPRLTCRGLDVPADHHGHLKETRICLKDVKVNL